MGKDTEYQISGRRVKIGSAKFVVTSTYFLPNIFSERYLAPRDPDARSLLNIQTIISNLRFQLETIFTRNLLYLGPLREYPKRYYFATGEVPRDVGLKGENVVELLYYDMKVRKRKADRTINLLKPWLEKFGLARDVRIEALPEGLYSLTLQDPHTRFEIDMSDTGFGVSQVLPVVVECLSAPQNSTVLIEQPEIHVHPKVQADLADLFIRACRERKIIVETHSEHLLLRIQRRIAEGELSPNDVAVYYFDPTHEGTQVSRLSFDESGSLKNWPVGFFEEDYQEALARQKALLGKIPVAES